MADQRGYRLHDSRPGVVIGVAAGVAALVVAALLVGWAMERHFTEQRPPESIRGPVPPSPRLEPDPGREAARFIRDKRDRLESYGWVDRDKGIAHIPIERAMDAFAEQRKEARR